MTRAGADLAMRAFAWVAVTEWRAHRASFSDLVGWLESRPLGARKEVPPAIALRAVARVYRTFRLRRSCLRESLATVGLLRSLGFPAALAIGVKDGHQDLDAHAWVEVGGTPITSQPEGYLSLARTPIR